MSDTADVRSEVRARLEWLRLMGVESVRRRPDAAAAATSREVPGSAARSPAPPPDAPSPSTAAPDTATPARADQTGLFAPADAVETPARAAGARGRPAAAASASPLVEALGDATAAADPEAALAALRADIGDCTRCRLSEKRTQVVFGVGSPHARLMFVGEGPGADEDAQGEPFVGRAGQLLTKIIEAMGLTRAEVYIANIVKCRPPENRTPLPDEVGTCSPFLMRQIAIIRPRVIVCLGTPSAQTMLGTRETITRLRGQFREVAGVRVMPTFHPAYLLRNPAAKREVWDDMKQVMAALRDDA